MRVNWVVEPLPDGWCRAWEVMTDERGRVTVGAERWARTGEVLWPEQEVTATEVPLPVPPPWVGP